MKIIFKSFLLIFLYVPIFVFPVNSQQTIEVGIEEQLGNIIPLDLTFNNAKGETVKLGDIITKPTVLSLVYFHCPTVCKPLLGAKVDVLDRIDALPGKDYQALTISFNERENHENATIIKENFLKRFKKPFPEDSWHFLTGSAENIKKITDAVGFRFKADGKDFIHPTALIMISPKGKVTRYLNGVTYLPFDVKLAMMEAGEGKVGPTISKILLYCFRYDPEGKRYVFNILKVTATISIMFGLMFVAWLVISTRKRKKEK
jgi:protein SCO1